VFEAVWAGEDLSEGDVVESAVVQQAETYEQVRDLFDDSDGSALWSRLQAAGEELREEHPDSPTTESVETTLAASRPPSKRRVRQLIERAKSPQEPETGGETWQELQHIAERLRQEVPHASITDRVTTAVESEERPTGEQADELLSEAKTVLRRLSDISKRIDTLEENSIVLIEESS
jgi:negative regulator of sigma E activity